jgi:micrococcal nuclease
MLKFNRISLATLLFIVQLSTLVWAEEPYQAKVVGISDGDTVKVLHNGNQVRIRLYGIDTPEKRQAFGTKAKQFTSQKVFKKTVRITPMDTDRYGRTVALVQMPGDYVSLNEALVWHGFAWVYRKYCRADFCRDWLEYENKAKAAGRGLWSDSNPIPPWEFRRR